MDSGWSLLPQMRCSAIHMKGRTSLYGRAMTAPKRSWALRTSGSFM